LKEGRWYSGQNKVVGGLIHCKWFVNYSSAFLKDIYHTYTQNVSSEFID